MHAVLQKEKTKKLHSVVKESSKFNFQLNTAQKEIDVYTKPTKTAKDISKSQKCYIRRHEKKIERETTT